MKPTVVAWYRVLPMRVGKLRSHQSNWSKKGLKERKELILNQVLSLEVVEIRERMISGH